MARVFLTGGGGFIGGQLAERLLARGDEVVGLARSDAAAAALAARGARVVRGDVLDTAVVADGLAGCEVAYHVAGVNSHCPRDPDRLLRVNVEGTRTVVEAAGAAGVRRVVFTSSAASLGEAQGTVGHEGTPHRGTYLSLYDRSKHEAEGVAFAAAREHGVEVVALNPSSVQGPPRTGGNGAIIIAYLNGTLRAFVDTHVSVVDVEDVVEAHVLASTRGTPGERYVLNGATIPSAEALRIVTELSGVQQRVPMVPARLARGAALAVDRVHRMRGRHNALCPERIATILHGHRYDGSRATRELGLVYTPVAETFRRTMEWAVAEGLVTRPLPGAPAPA